MVYLNTILYETEKETDQRDKKRESYRKSKGESTYQEGREGLQVEVVYRPAAHSSPRAHPQTAGEAGQPATAGSGQPTT